MIRGEWSINAWRSKLETLFVRDDRLSVANAVDKNMIRNSWAVTWGWMDSCLSRSKPGSVAVESNSVTNEVRWSRVTVKFIELSFCTKSTWSCRCSVSNIHCAARSCVVLQQNTLSESTLVHLDFNGMAILYSEKWAWNKEKCTQWWRCPKNNTTVHTKRYSRHAVCCASLPVISHQTCPMHHSAWCRNILIMT